MLAAFFGCALVHLLVAAAFFAAHAITGSWELHWLALHVAFVGGVSQLVLGAGQFFAGAFLATGPPPRPLVRGQLATWNAGAVLVAAGVPTGTDALVWAGAVLLAVGLSLFLAGLRWLRRHSLQDVPWSVRWYEACALFLGAGVLAGVGLATGAGWLAGNLLGAHMALNLAGWFGTAIAGTLHTFYPSLTQTQLRFQRLQAPTFAAWTGGVALLAAGAAMPSDPALVLGWSALLLAAALLGVNLLSCAVSAPKPLSLGARLVGAGHAFLVVALALAIVAIAQDGPRAPLAVPDRALLATLLLPGWLGLTVAGSLHHLLGVLVRVRDLGRPVPAARPGRDRLLAALAILAAASLALTRIGSLGALEPAAGSALAIAYALLGAQVLSRAARAIRLIALHT